MPLTNPLIAETRQETTHNIQEAMSALLVLMAPGHSDLCRLWAPIMHAVEHLEDAESNFLQQFTELQDRMKEIAR